MQYQNNKGIYPLLFMAWSF